MRRLKVIYFLYSFLRRAYHFYRGFAHFHTADLPAYILAASRRLLGVAGAISFSFYRDSPHFADKDFIIEMRS